MAPSKALTMVLNAGSSSLKFKVFEKVEGKLQALASGLCERIGDTANSRMKVGRAVSFARWLGYDSLGGGS